MTADESTFCVKDWYQNSTEPHFTSDCLEGRFEGIVAQTSYNLSQTSVNTPITKANTFNISNKIHSDIKSAVYLLLARAQSLKHEH